MAPENGVDFIDKETIRARYNALASRYGRHYSNPRSILSLEKKRRSQILEDHLVTEQPLRILDLGCGSGHVTSRVAEVLPQTDVIGIDLSDQMLDIAREFCADSASFVRGDVEFLPFPSTGFGFVYALGVLEKFDNLAPLLRETHRILRSGGKFFFTYPNRFSISMLVRRFGYRLRNGRNTPSNKHWLDVNRMMTSLHEIGFTIEGQYHITYGNGVITLPWSKTVSLWLEKILGHRKRGNLAAMSTIWVVSKNTN
jgi:SAM-dependent methyltransferase